MIAQRVDQLLLVHARAPLDSDLPGLVVEVRLGPLLVLGRPAAPPGRELAGGVGDAGRLLLAHAFPTQRLVALVVLDLRSVIPGLGHGRQRSKPWARSGLTPPRRCSTVAAMHRSLAWLVVPLALTLGCGGSRSGGDGAVTLGNEAGDGDGDPGTSGDGDPLLDMSAAEGMMEAGDEEGPGEGTACEQAAAYNSSQGCEFWAADLPNAWQVTLGPSAEQQPFGIVVTNTASETANVEIFVGKQLAPLESAQIPPGALHVFKFCNSLGLTSQGNTKGIGYRIESDRPVTAYQYNPLDNSNPVYSNDASLLFPTHVLDTDYTAITGDALWMVNANGGAFVTAIATEDDTTVVFYPPAGITMYPGDTTVTLDRG